MIKCKKCGSLHMKGHEHLKVSGGEALALATKKMRKSIRAKKHREESKVHEAGESKEVEAKEDKKKHKGYGVNSYLRGTRFTAGNIEATKGSMTKPSTFTNFGKIKSGSKNFK